MNKIISRKKTDVIKPQVVEEITLEMIEKDILEKKEAREKNRIQMIEKIRIDTYNTMIQEKNKLEKEREIEYINRIYKPKIIRKKNNSTQTDPIDI